MFLAHDLPDEYLEAIAEVKADRCCFDSSPENDHMSLETLKDEHRLIMHRELAYS